MKMINKEQVMNANVNMILLLLLLRNLNLNTKEKFFLIVFLMQYILDLDEFVHMLFYHDMINFVLLLQNFLFDYLLNLINKQLFHQHLQIHRIHP